MRVCKLCKIRFKTEVDLIWHNQLHESETK